MNGDAWIVLDRLGQTCAFESHKIDVDAAGGERPRVILNACASAEVGQRNNDGAHGVEVGLVLKSGVEV